MTVIFVPIILVISFLLQFTAAFLALRLIRITGRQRAWLFIAAGTSLMAIRRGITLLQVFRSELSPDPIAELIALAISVLMVFGVAWIPPIFLSIKRSEKELRESAQKWQTTFDAISDAVCLLDLKGRILQCNIAMTKLLGKPSSEIIGCKCCGLIHGTSEPITECPFVRMCETHQRETMDFSIGSQWFSVSVDPVLDETGKLAGAIHIIADITERKAAEDALVASKAYTESIIQNFLDTLVVVDAEAKIQTVNPATCRLLGYTEEELKGQPVSMIFAEEEEEEEVKRLFQFFREPEKAETPHPQDTIRNREFTYKTKDGQLVPMLFNASMLTDEMGNVIGVVAGAKNITEIRQAQEALRKTEDKFRNVIENIFKFVPEGLLVLTDKLNVFRRNKALEDLVHQYAEKLNYTEEELTDIITEQVKMRIISGEKSDIRIPRNQR